MTHVPHTNPDSPKPMGVSCPRCGKTGLQPDSIHTCTPRALVLADALEKDKWHVLAVTLQEAAEELRRLHSENVQNAVDFVEHQRELSKALDQRDELLVALEGLVNALDSCIELTPELIRAARAAIAKVEGGAA